MKISEILPAKKSSFDEHQYYKPYPQYLSIPYEEKYKREGYNQAIDDCAEAISRANLVCCPSTSEILDIVHESKICQLGNAGLDWQERRENKVALAKALLALLHNENKDAK